VLEASIAALTANERAGLTRDEAQAVLAPRAPTTAPVTPTLPPPPPPPPSVTPSRWAAGVTYGAQAPAGASPIAHGPGLLLALAHDPRGQERGQGLLFWVSGQWSRLETGTDETPFRVGLDTIAARAGVEVGTDAGIGLRAGAGADFVHVQPRTLAPEPGVAPARWSTDFVVSLAGRANLAVLGPIRLAGLFTLDVTPTAISYDVETNGVRSPVFSPWRVRPGIAVELHVRPIRAER
jgi:hypothetical protein